jgi:serine/threonine-protein kinase RIO1
MGKAQELKELRIVLTKFYKIMNEKKIKELVGIITEKESAKVYSQGKNQGKLYYRLLVKCENRPKVNTIFAFREIVEKESV